MTMRKNSILILALFSFIPSLHAGSIVRLVYDGIGGTAVSNLTASPIFPNNPTRQSTLTSLLEAPANDGDNFGAYLRGWIEAPQTGNYTFWIASDDQSELWVSTGITASNKVKIAFEPLVSTPRDWDGLAGRNPYAPENKSALIPMVRGQKYYFEVLHKEGGGGDHVAVGWRLPDLSPERPMSLLHVQQYQPSNLAPVITQSPQNISIPAHNSATFSVAVTASPPPVYQWQRSDDGVNFFSIPNATLSYYTLQAAPPTANGALFRVLITNGLGNATSAAALLTVTADNVAPTVLSAAVLDAPNCVNHDIEVIFSEPVDPATASDPFNFTLTKAGMALPLTGVTTSLTRPERVVLHAVQPLGCGGYSLSVVAVQDTVGNPIFAAGGAIAFDTTLLACCNQSYTLDLSAGFTAIANQLTHGGNTLAEVLPLVPDGTMLAKLDPFVQTFLTNTYLGAVGWTDPNMTLAPGEGAIIYLPATGSGTFSIKFSITFTGSRVQPVLPPPLVPGFNLISRQEPLPASFEDILGFPPTEGSVVAQFDSVLQMWRTNYFLNGVWHDHAPVCAIGEPVVYSQQSPVVITVQPFGSTNTTPGSSVTFSVVATGTDNLLYHWRRNGNPISGAINSTLTIPNAQLADGGSYSVAVENTLGGVSSVEVVLNFNLVPFAFADNFENALVLQSLDDAVTGSNVGATNQTGEARHAGKKGGSSVWMNWMAPVTGIVTFETSGSTFDTMLAAYTGDYVTNLTEVASDEDDAGFLASRISFNAQSGVTYHIAVDGFHGVAGDIVLGWQLEETSDRLPVITTQPQELVVAPGDDVQFTVNATGLNLGYQWSLNGAAISGATAHTYSFTNAQIQNVGTYRVRVFESGRFLDSHPALLQLNAGGPGEPLQDVHAPDKFFDVVEQAAAGSGPGAARGGPARGVQVVTHGYSGTQLFSTSSSTKDVGEPNHAGVVGGASEWFAYEATNNGTLYLSTEGSSFDTVLAVYIGPGNSYVTLTNVTSDNNSGSNGFTSKVSFPATNGVTYWVAVDGNNTNTSAYGPARGSVNLLYRFVSPLSITNVVETTNNNGRIIFKVNSTPNLLTKVQSSTNLSFTNWTSLLTNTPVSGSFSFTNTNLFSLPQKFYRAINQF